jgi:epoxyqueuosine reductase
MPTSISEDDGQRGGPAPPPDGSPPEYLDLGERLKEELRAFALEAGFVAFGVCRPDAIPQAAGRLEAYVDAGRHGQMGWMAERMGWRGDPAALWPEARSVVMLAESYAPEHDPLAVLDRPDRAAVSVYAQGRDYHDVVKARLKKVGRWLIDRSPGAEIKVFVDTAPVMEKPLAQAAGIGWQGKHTNLLGRDFGNWVFLGAIFTTVERCRPMWRRRSIAGVAPPVWMSARPRRSRRRFSSTRGGAFPT